MNYIQALDWLETNYPKYDINDRIRIIELAKSGGPFIGPRGGKYKDPQHKIPWSDSYDSKYIAPIEKDIKDIEKDIKNTQEKMDKINDKIVSIYVRGESLYLHQGRARADTNSARLSQYADRISELRSMLKKKKQDLEDTKDYKNKIERKQKKELEIKAINKKLRVQRKETNVLLNKLLDSGKKRFEFDELLDSNKSYKDASDFYNAHKPKTSLEAKEALYIANGIYTKLLKEWLIKNNLNKSLGPFIGPKGGKWADPQHTIPWKEETGKRKAPGSQLPDSVQKKLKELNIDKLPQADIPVSDIRVDLSGDVDGKAVIAWRDAKGKIQSGYTPVFHKNNAEKKWKRVQAFRDKKPKLIADINDKLNTVKKGTTEHQGYTVLSIIAETGLRPGSTESVKKHGHYGISTLAKDHVKIEKGMAVIQFVGKSGKTNTTIVKNPNTVNSLKYYLKQKSNNLFQPSALDNTKSVMPKGMKVKDLRTIKATETAEKFINAVKEPPPLTGNKKKDQKLLAKALFETSKTVSSILNNTPAVAKASYIHPMVFEKWANKIGASRELWTN